MTWFTLILVLVSFAQWRAMRDELTLTRDSIQKAQAVAVCLAAYMKASITEATRAAGAMESISKSLATNVNQLTDMMSVYKRMGEATTTAVVLAHRARIAYVKTDVTEYVEKYADVAVWYENSGTAPAVIIESNFQSAFGLPEDLPETPDFERTARTEEFAAHINRPVDRHYKLSLSDETFAKTRNGEIVYLLWGYVKYRDGFPDTPVRTTRFGVIFNPARARGYFPIQKPGYNYTD